MSNLFTIGPVEMFEETLKIGGKQVPYFRNDEFSQVVFSASAGLKLDMKLSCRIRTSYSSCEATGVSGMAGFLVRTITAAKAAATPAKVKPQVK